MCQLMMLVMLQWSLKANCCTMKTWMKIWESFRPHRTCHSRTTEEDTPPGMATVLVSSPMEEGNIPCQAAGLRMSPLNDAEMQAATNPSAAISANAAG